MYSAMTLVLLVSTPKAKPVCMTESRDRSRARHAPARRSNSGSWQVVSSTAAARTWRGAELGVPARTVSRILRRHQMPRLCECDPLTAHAKARIGYDYAHSVVDDHSQLACSEILRRRESDRTAECFARAIAYFADHGIAHIERLITDNAWNYRRSGALHELLEDH